jgi:hypothetical protein
MRLSRSMHAGGSAILLAATNMAQQTDGKTIIPDSALLYRYIEGKYKLYTRFFSFTTLYDRMVGLYKPFCIHNSRQHSHIFPPKSKLKLFVLCPVS